MKKIIHQFLVLVCLTCLLFTANSYSQFHFQKSRAGSTFVYGDILSNPLGDGSLIEARVSEPALKAFSRSFKNSTASKWYRVGKFYLVDFTINENENKALYDVKGNLKYSINYGSEKDLPGNIRKMIKREYVEYNILQAINVCEESRNIWVINLDDDANLITARVEHGSIEETGRYRKTKM